MSKPIVISGMMNSYTGYGQHCLEVAKYFLRKGRDVSVRPIHQWEDFGSKIPEWVKPYLRYEPHPWPTELILYTTYHVPNPKKRNIYFTMWETDTLHDQGREHMNQAELVIVPCLWNLESFTKAKIRPPIERVPLGVNTDVFQPKPMKMVGPTIFGAAGRLKHGKTRKGVNQVIDMFRKAFPKERDVELWIKSFPDEKELSVPEDKRIVVNRNYLTDEELAKWYAGLTCFVSAARGEGWGLMQQQAMACGRPVVAPIYGGLREFMNTENSYAVPFDVVPADENYSGHGKWAVVKEDAMIDMMRFVHKDRLVADAKGMLASVQTNLLTWHNSCVRLEMVLGKHGII